MANDIGYLLANAARTNADFGALGKIGEAIKQGRIDEMRQAALNQYAAGDPSALIKSGDLQLANLYMQDKARTQSELRDVRDFQFRQDEARRSQSNTDRGYSLQERSQTRLENPPPEAGFRVKADDPTSQEFIPGGSKDPAYLSSIAKPRQMSVTDIGKLSEEGGKLSELRTFVDTFKPEYGGHYITGDLANVAGRNLPEAVVGPTAARGATFWQGYDRFKNVVRNELYGSALTLQEKQAFEQADVNPRMDPAQIKKNLDLQKRITERAITRKAEALIQQGYDPEVISRAYGLKFQGRVPSAPNPGGAPASPGAVGGGGAVDWQSYFGGQR